MDVMLAQALPCCPYPMSSTTVNLHSGWDCMAEDESQHCMLADDCVPVFGVYHMTRSAIHYYRQ